MRRGCHPPGDCDAYCVWLFWAPPVQRLRSSGRRRAACLPKRHGTRCGGRALPKIHAVAAQKRCNLTISRADQPKKSAFSRPWAQIRPIFVQNYNICATGSRLIFRSLPPRWRPGVLDIACRKGAYSGEHGDPCLAGSRRFTCAALPHDLLIGCRGGFNCAVERCGQTVRRGDSWPRGSSPRDDPGVIPADSRL